MTAESLISTKLQELQERRRAYLNELRQVETKLHGVNAQMTVLTEILEAAKNDGDEPDDDKSDDSSSASVIQVSPHAPMVRVRGRGVTFSVASLLRDNPAGMTASAIVAALKDNIETNSADRPRVIRNTLLNMRRRGALVEDDGVYRLAASHVRQLVDIDDL